MRWRVLVPLPVPPYDFRPPYGFSGEALGRRLLVPWQGGARVGLVAEVVPEDGTETDLKEAIAVLDPAPLLDPGALATLLQVAARTLAPAGLVACDLVPFGLEPEVAHRARLVPGLDLAGLPHRAASLTNWSDAADHDPGLLDFLRGQGLLEETAELVAPTRAVIRPVGETVEALPDLTPKQATALETLRRLGRAESASAWAREAGVSPTVVAGLVRRRLAASGREPLPPPEPRAPQPDAPPPARRLELPPDMARLHGGRPRDRYAALAGLIRAALGGVLYLAPDRATLERAWLALGRVRPSSLIHMGLSERERAEVWRRAASGERPVVFGTPMALLAPVPDLRLVVVDEEGSDAYKMGGGARLFAPDAARVRAETAGARLVLTGAAPAVESLPLPGVVLTPPRARFHVVDYGAQEPAPETGPLSRFPPVREGWPLATPLKRLLRQVAERSRQAVLIAPRRGYSAVLRCADCGWLPFCPNCDVPLRLHLSRGALECHQCGHMEAGPRACPRCEGRVLHPRGPGSEWITAELARFLPGFPVYRYDRDRRDDLAALERGEPGVVVGTVAVLGRPAPPDLALVGLTFADTLATHPDFRAAERYHALLRRLVEWHPTRAPLILVQTFAGGHPALAALLEGRDAASYPESELPARERYGYPPFAHLAQVQVAARRTADAERAAKHLAALILDRGASEGELLGPAPAPIAKLKGLYAHNLLLRAPTPERLAHLLEPARRFGSGARVRVDVNPRSLSELLE